jgi:hypothetical protein
MSEFLPGQTMLFGPVPEPAVEEWNKEKTLADAKRELFNAMDDGTRCPCCDKYVRRYRRKFNSSMARALIWLHKESEKRTNPQDLYPAWVDVPALAPRWLVRTNQLPTVRWWGMIERHPMTKSDKKHSGLWRPTRLGGQFVVLGVRVPSTVVTYNGEPAGFEGDPTTIRESLGTKFDYAELMGHH